MFSLLDDIVTKSAKQNGTKPGGDIVTTCLRRRVSEQAAIVPTLWRSGSREQPVRGRLLSGWSVNQIPTAAVLSRRRYKAAGHKTAPADGTR